MRLSRQHAASRLHVGGDLVSQFIDAGKLALTAYGVDEGDIEFFAVDVAGEFKQMDFEGDEHWRRTSAGRLGSRLRHRTDPDNARSPRTRHREA